MPENSLIKKYKKKIIKLCILYKVKKLEIFGSATGDNFNNSLSDLDFLVEFLALSTSEHAECYFNLLENLQDIFKRDIDLIEIKAINNPHLLESIEKSRNVLYAA